MDVVVLKQLKSSSMWTTYVLWSAVQVVITVLADDDDDDDHTTTRNHEHDGCGGVCDYGCCGDQECCDPPDTMPTYTVQIIAVVGAFLVTLMLLLLCFARYQCVNKIRRTTGNTQRRRPGNRTSSVFALGGLGEWPVAQGGQLVQPPPYSEEDPLSSPDSNTVQFGVPPPAYSDVVKNTVIVVPEENTPNSTQGQTTGLSGEGSVHI